MEHILSRGLCSFGGYCEFGDAPAIASASAGTKGYIHPKTAEQKLARKNELKAKSTLLLAIPNELLLKFYRIKDANTLWEEIKARFRGNKESKKMQKTILKQNMRILNLKIQKMNIKFRGGLLGLKDFKMILRVTTAQLQLLSDYYCWKDYADRDEIKD
ncbi:hypothetical protein Tco_0665005 [Tanacetum coccineum]